MMAAIWGLLTSRLAGPIASGVAVMLAGALAWQTVALGFVRYELAGAVEARDKAQTDFTTCKANTTTLEAALEAQSRAVAGLKAESDRRVAQSAKAARDARAVAESARRHADRVLAMRAPEDVCAGALDVLRGG